MYVIFIVGVGYTIIVHCWFTMLTFCDLLENSVWTHDTRESSI